MRANSSFVDIKHESEGLDALSKKKKKHCKGIKFGPQGRSSSTRSCKAQ